MPTPACSASPSAPSRSMSPRASPSWPIWIGWWDLLCAERIARRNVTAALRRFCDRVAEDPSLALDPAVFRRFGCCSGQGRPRRRNLPHRGRGPAASRRPVGVRPGLLSRSPAVLQCSRRHCGLGRDRTCPADRRGDGVCSRRPPSRAETPPADPPRTRRRPSTTTRHSSSSITVGGRRTAEISYWPPSCGLS